MIGRVTTQKKRSAAASVSSHQAVSSDSNEAQDWRPTRSVHHTHLQLLRRQVPVWSWWLCWTVGPRLCGALRSNMKTHRSDYHRRHCIRDMLKKLAHTLAGLAVLFLLAGLDWSSLWSSGLTWGGSDWPEPWAPPDAPGWGLHAWERPQTCQETETEDTSTKPSQVRVWNLVFAQSIFLHKWQESCEE